MGRSDNRAALTDAVARFQAEIQQLAFAMVRAAIKHELESRVRPEPARRQKRKPPRSPRRTPPRQLELGLAQGSVPQLELPLARQAEHAATRQVEPPAGPGAEPAAQPHEPPASSPAGRRKRVPWTRETIVSELATWMLSGTAIDAQFMTRHGPRGLVAAVRRVFGRFDAALNVAALHVSKLYPDGPPPRGTSLDRPATAAQPSSQEPR